MKFLLGVWVQYRSRVLSKVINRMTLLRALITPILTLLTKSDEPANPRSSFIQATIRVLL